jgi:NitT/TauT family transport system permease protein
MKAARRPLYAVAGAIALLLLIELVGRTEAAGKTWPPLTDVVGFIVDPAHTVLLSNAFFATIRAAGLGAVIGTVAGVLAAVVALLLPVSKPGLDRSAALLEATPAIAIAPFLALSAGRDTTPVIIPAFSVAFIMYLSMSSAFAGVSRTRHDLLSVFGSPPRKRLFWLQLPSALPSFFDALTLSVPAAIIGAMIGEFFGASRGLGVLVVSAMQNFQITLLWAAALLSVICSLIGYLIFSILQRRVFARFA